MSRLELINLEGLRVDGRRPNELRKLNTSLGILSEADGSAYLEIGNTKVLATVYGPRDPRSRGLGLLEQASLFVDITMSPFSTNEHKKRAKNDKRMVEMATAVRQTFEPIVLPHINTRSGINIYLQILQHDGGLLQSCINVTTLALIHAGIPMTDYVVCTSLGLVDKTPILDVNYTEETSGQTPDVTVAITPTNGNIALLLVEDKLHTNDFKDLIELGVSGCHQIKSLLEERVTKFTEELTHKYQPNN